MKKFVISVCLYVIMTVLILAFVSVSATGESEQIKSIKFKDKTLTIAYGKTVQPEIIIKPDTAAGSVLSWSVSEDTVCKVDEEGNITAVGVGDCVITCTAMDGSDKKANISVHVPVFDTTVSEWTVEQPDWFLIPVDLHSVSPSSITMKASNNKSFLSYFDEKGIHVYPIATGNADITLSSKMNKKDTSKYKITINEGAVDTSGSLKAVVALSNSYPGYSDKVKVDYYITGGKKPYQLATISYSQALLYCIDDPQTSQFGDPMFVDLKSFPAGSVTIGSYTNSGIAGKTVLTVVDAEGNTITAYGNRVYPMSIGVSAVKDYWAAKKGQTIHEEFRLEDGSGTYNCRVGWTENVNGAWKPNGDKRVKSASLFESEFTPGYCDSVMYSFDFMDAKDKSLGAYTDERWIKMTDDVEGYFTTEESYYQHVGDEIVVQLYCSKDIEIENASWDLISANNEDDFQYEVEHRDMTIEKVDDNMWEAKFVVEECDFVRFAIKLTDSYSFRRDFKVIR